MSKGEKKLLEVLEIEFPGYRVVSQFPIRPRKGKILYVDFVIPELNLAFEFDGIQHQKRIPFFSETERDFRVSKQRDVIKSRLLSEMDYTLIRINYNEEITQELVRRKLQDALK